MRLNRFKPWLWPVIDANLPEGVERLDWGETGIGKDPGVGEHTDGIVLRSPAGGVMYMSVTNANFKSSGDSYDEPERIVEGNPPEPAAPIDLKVSADGRIRMADLEEWLMVVLNNAGNKEMDRVERLSTREAMYQPQFGFCVYWHSLERTYSTPFYTLQSGQRRTEESRFKISEAF
ncbi:hypothetical protein [Myceligenerans pegani]|uniref:Uncharacterized protein n=1 Tax=Myceligenerans pegani TaxID=2776917 RepID=A0ABR9N4W2_9MICO|nr:hypothetical protein [Myceligenerans sp. TRM 65318]MBE1878712.1 hypothetical protein [Myceligenerans sp. TRM 65318]MBE3020983.1 hypothetical protein [Myceligenerans sp. TRM 65318]